jgi:hypothetical protein
LGGAHVIESDKYSAEPKKWYLEAVADAKRKWMAPIEPVPFFIGRDETCNLKLTDNQVSRRHSMISKSGNYLWICDLESTNGHLAPKRCHEMVSTFVKASQQLGISTIAEGIECQNEAETCQKLGFDFAQGFFYGRSLPI